MSYVDGYVLAVPRDHVEAYREFVQTAGKVWMEHGALHYVECLAEDVPYGNLTSFPRAVMAKEDEVVVFSWIIFESKEVRDSVNSRVMDDPRLKDFMSQGVIDMSRMIFGGFTPLVELSAPAAPADRQT
jgi:uncharacterized protein YbaA (DUF1428 family)